MKVVIVGAGDIGCDLADTLLKHKHQITIIEKEPEAAANAVKELNTVVITGDGTDLSMLKDAEADKADVFIAVTPRDQDNFIACQLASSKFNVPRTIARVTKPYNLAVFASLGGITNTVSATDIISKLVEEEVADEQVSVLQVLKEGKAEIIRVKVRVKSMFDGKTLHEVQLPDNCVVTAVLRGGDVVPADSPFTFKPGDEIIAVATSEGMIKLGRMLRETEDNR